MGLKPTMWAAALVAAGALLGACLPTDRPAPQDSAAGSCRITRVVDGDTVDLACPGHGTQRARLVGYDTPETSQPQCRAEHALGLRASARLTELQRTSTRMDAQWQGIDRYGRSLVRLRIDGADLARIMISEGLAVPYSGGRRIDWCALLG